MRSRHFRFALVLLGLAVALTVPQLLLAHVSVQSQETTLRDEFLLFQLRLPAYSWGLGGLPGYLLWVVALVVPGAFAFFPRLRRFGAGAAGLLLGVAMVAGGAPKAFVAVAMILGANFVPAGLAFPRARPAAA